MGLRYEQFVEFADEVRVQMDKGIVEGPVEILQLIFHLGAGKEMPQFIQITGTH